MAKGPAPRAVSERFFAKVDMSSTTCWLWTGATMKNGYGRFGVAAGDVRFAHRWSYEWHIGPIPDGLTIDHLCGVKACVKPGHLEPVSRGDNVRRHFVQQTHCKHGHSLEDALQHHGRRECRACNRGRCARRRVEDKQ